MKRKPFYGWIIVFTGMLVIGASIGIANNCMNQYIKPISETFGYTRQEASLILTILSLVSMAAALVAGKLFTRKRIMTLMRIGMALTVISFFGFSLARELYQFYLLAGTLAIGQVLTAFLPFSVLIGNWFHRKQGLALGLTFMGSGVGGMAFSVVTGACIEAYGWQVSFRLLSAVIAAILVPSLCFVIKAHPDDLGLLPLGDAPDAKTHAREAEGLGLSDALKSPLFWAAALGMLFVGMTYTPISVLLVPHMTDSGYSGLYAAQAQSVFMAMLAAGKIALGALYDRLGEKRATLLALGALFVGNACMLAITNFAALAAVAVIGGFGCSLGTIAPPILVRKCFGTRDYGALTGILTAANSLGCALTPALSGGIYDATGSYRADYVAMLALLAVNAAIFTLVFAKSRRSRSL